MVLLEVKDIWVHYGRVEAVKGISITVEENTIVSIVGSNGAGKTTTLKAVFGLKKTTSGEILFRGRRVDGLSPQGIAKLGIAYSLEGRRLFPLMTISENLEMGAYLRRDPAKIKSDMEEIYQRLPILKQREKQDAGTLSGGEQQMLAIGRALMSRPQLLMLDEPSLGLAPLIIREIGTIIRDINQRGMTVVLVEQNSKLGLGVATKAYVMEVGKIALGGDTRELIRNEHVKKVYLGL
jgi:branched-chain amino acid transport system ATP-binding protein